MTGPSHVAAGPSGVLVVHKPRGPTSHDVVAQARRLLGTRAVGHAGTLDPMASGVLVLLVGEATKLSPYVTADSKVYRAIVAFGRSTHTLDAEGETTAEAPLPPGFPDPLALEAALQAERQRTEQVPPLVSALHVDGERAHRLARRGETPELPPRPVTLHRLELLRSGPDSVTVELAVGKGYYVRSFARDLGETLGVPAHLAALERRSSGPYGLESAIAWPPAASPPLLSLAEAACRALPKAILTAEGTTRARQGKQLTDADFESPPPAELAAPSAWLGPDGALVAIGVRGADGAFQVVRGFREIPP